MRDIRLSPGLRQKGDTIVEVLIATAVICSVLIGAFTVTQRSVQAVRASQEHSQVLELLKAQVELVRGLALTQTSDTAGVYTPGDFCISLNPTSGMSTRVEASNQACRSVDSLYNLSERYDAVAKHFIFVGDWDGFHGDNHEQLLYRIYPGSIVSVVTPPNPAPTIPPFLAPVPTPVPAITPPVLPTNLSASVSDRGCTPTIATGICETPPPKYYWTAFLRNTTNNSAKTVKSCVWKWNELPDTVDKSCQYLDAIDHEWVHIPNIEPYPAGCGKYVRNYSLTVTYTDNSTAYKSFSEHMPYCYH